MADAAWFAGRLRELREAAGWTQGELAGRAGLTREGVAQLETGRRKPAWETVLALCDALGVSSEEFRKAPRVSSPPRAGRPPKKAAQAAETAAKRSRGRAKQ
jgi:transcriptional regulator with XRE-family HTH domain